LALLLIQFTGDNCEKGNELVATPTFIQMGNPLTFKPKDCARLAASRNFEFGCAIQGGYLYLSTESSPSKINWQLIENIITISGEKLMLFNRQGNVEVAGRATLYSGLTFTAKVYLRTVINSWWDLDRDTALMFFLACALTLRARLSDNPAIATAPIADGSANKATKYTLLDSTYLSSAATFGAAARLTTWLATNTLA